METQKTLKIFLIAGEPSGDALGGKLMSALKKQTEGKVQFAGVGGVRMQEQGMESLFPMSELSIMGFAEIIPHIPHLLGRIRQTAAAIAEWQPDVVVTIDAPEFCFRVAKKIQHLRKEGIKLVHYVAPSVWAYREHRAAAIARLYDHLLALLPFEPPYFEKEGLACTFIGHSVIEENMAQGDGARFREKHQIAADSTVLCMTPGSRNSEFARLWPVFSEVAEMLSHRIPSLVVVIPTVPKLEETVRKAAISLKAHTIVVAETSEKKDALSASDVALAKSGTGTFEVAMAHVPMIVAYKVKPFSAWLARRLLKIRYVNLINLILNREVIPEYLQERCTPALLAPALEELLASPSMQQAQREAATEALEQLGMGKKPLPSERAAEVVIGIGGRG